MKVTALENIAQIQDYERLFRRLSAHGRKLIFGTTFSPYASLKKLAPTLPKSHFECCAGIAAGTNLGVFGAHRGTDHRMPEFGRTAHQVRLSRR